MCACLRYDQITIFRFLERIPFALNKLVQNFWTNAEFLYEQK